jgi:hypothetical protein
MPGEDEGMGVRRGRWVSRPFSLRMMGMHPEQQGLNAPPGTGREEG